MKQIDIPHEVLAEWPSRAANAIRNLERRYPGIGKADEVHSAGELVISVQAHFGDRRSVHYGNLRQTAIALLCGSAATYVAEATIGEDTSDRSGSTCWIFRLARWDAAKRAGQPLVKVHLYHHPLHGCHRSIELCRMSFDESLLLNEACRIATDFVHAVTLGMEMPAPKPPEALTCPP
ncbi:MAG TPA: hypothetical protein VJJ47_01500 [Candidatus Paceibacterota bacterium]